MKTFLIIGLSFSCGYFGRASLDKAILGKDWKPDLAWLFVGAWEITIVLIYWNTFFDWFNCVTQ